MAHIPPMSSTPALARSSAVRLLRVHRLPLLLLLAIVLATAFLAVAPAHVARAQEPTLAVDKTIFGNLSQEESGAEFRYFLAYSCSSLDVDCKDAQLVDTLPAGMEFLSADLPSGTNSSATYTPATGSTPGTVTVNFGMPLQPNGYGLVAGSSGLVVLHVRFAPGTIPGTPAVNQVAFSAGSVTTGIQSAPPITPTGQFEMFARKRIITSPVVQGEPIEFALEICSPDAFGGIPFVNPVLTDTIPGPPAVFLGADGQTGASGTNWTYDSATGRLVMTNPGLTVPVGGCFTRTMKLRYPVDTVPNIGQTNVLSVSGTPQGCNVVPASRPAYCNGKGERTLTPASVNYTVGVPFGSLNVSKSSDAASSFYGTEALAGENISYSVGADNDGYLDLTSVVVTDTIPVSFVLSSMLVGPYNSQPVTLTYSTSGGAPWTPVNGSPFSVAATRTVAELGIDPATVKALKWELGDMDHASAPAWQTRLFGTVMAGTAAGASFTNNARGVATDPEGKVISDTALASVKVIEERSIPRAVKESSATGKVLPGDIITFTVRIKNEAVAHLPIANPMMADLLPVEFQYQDGTFRVVSQPALAATFVTTETLPNYDSTGRTLLRARFTSNPADFSLLPGDEIVLSYAVKVVEGTPPGPIVNKAIISGSRLPAVPTCPIDEQVTDTNDVDGDGVRNETFCQNPDGSGGSSVGVLLALESRKLVKGIFDLDYAYFGHTTPGGTADYKLTITNTSNVPLDHIVIVDILPYINDRGVIVSADRKSVWQPNLVGPVVGPDDVKLTVYYSESTNPCRPEFTNSPGCVNDWKTKLPLNPLSGDPDPTLVRAVKLDFSDTTGYESLARDGKLTVNWPMRAPVEAPKSADTCMAPGDNDCYIAWNSFGVTAQGGGLQFLPTEPVKVGIVAKNPPTGVYGVGDFVWLDVAGKQNDGVQQVGEQGLNGIRVELHALDGFLLGRTLTANDQFGKPGYYLFDNLGPAEYYLRFFKPDFFSASPADQGDDTKDSDGKEFGTDPTYGPYYDTALFTLGVDGQPRIDTTRDFGLVRISDYGDAPYGKYTAWNGMSDADSLLAARHIFLSTGTPMRMGALRDAELDGQPSTAAIGDDTNGSDDEDGVTLPNVISDVSGTGTYGTLVQGKQSTITIAVTAPSTQTAYLNAWIDWNGDAIWAPDEQIAAHVVKNGGGNGPGIITLNVTPPANAVNTTYARFRLSPVQNLGPTGTVYDGEVEDYRIQVIAPPAKSIAATSEGHTGGANVVPGEIISYTLRAAIPEGNVQSVIFTDILPLGLKYIGNISVIVESNVAMSLANNPPAVNAVTFSDGTDPVFTFGNVLNNDNDNDLEYITLKFNALVLNNTANAGGRFFDNGFTFRYTGFTHTTPTVRATLVHPALTISKALLTSPVDAGDPVKYRVFVANAGGVTVFNATITDTLDSNLGNPVVTSSTTPPSLIFTNSPSGNFILNATVPEIKSGESLVFTVTANVKDDVLTTLSIPNTARTTWTSLPGANGTPNNLTGANPPGLPGAEDGERTGVGGSPNTYIASANRAALLTGAPYIAKVVGKTLYTIGEDVIYTLTVRLPEGVTKNVVVTDTLPAGLGYSSATLVTTGFTGAPTPSATTTVNGQVLTWSFGDLTIAGTPLAGTSSFKIRVMAVVQNAIANQRLQTRTNKASLIYDNPAGGRNTTPAGSAVVTLVEPVLLVTKGVVTAPNADAGNVVTYTINLSHDSSKSAGTAWGVVLSDTLPTSLENFAISKISGSGFGFIVPSAAIAGGVLRVPPSGTFDLPWGATVRVVVTATIKDSTTPGAIVTNNAAATWSSLNGTPAEERIAGDGLLDGGGLNDYEVRGTATFNIANQASVTKALVNSSAPHTSDPSVTIGEVITYRIPVTLGEGTIASLRITDNVPPGMAYVGGSLVFKTIGTGGPNPTPTSTHTADGTDGQDVVVTFGQIVVPGDNNPANNSFALELQLRVLDVAANIGFTGSQKDLPNDATWQTGIDVARTTNTVNVTVVEPKMTIVKKIMPATAAANDVVTVTLVVNNVGTSTAFSATLTDTLPTGLAYDSDLISKSGLQPASLTESGGTVRAIWADFAAGASSTIEFRARLAAGSTNGQVIVNTAFVDDATTLPGTPAGERKEPRVQSQDDVTVIAPDLRIIKTDAKTNVVAGEMLVYALTVTNDGDRTADGVVITETVPANTTFVGSPSSDNAWMRSPGGTVACATGDAAGTVCTLAVGTMAPTAQVIKNFAVLVDSDILRTVTTIVNTATTHDDGTHGPDPDLTNNTTTDTDNHVSAALGDHVWLDTNGNGIQDEGAAGVQGVTVKLLDGSGNAIAGKTTTTDASGYYSFTNLVPADYIVEFVAPAGQGITLRNVGDAAADSDADRVTGRSPTVTLLAREYNQTIDAGLYVPAELGNYVWLDANVDGVQDGDESPVGSVTVKLYRTGENTAISTTVTNASGYYSFTNLIPGSYFIEVTPPTGYNISPVQNSTPGGDTDSDVSPVVGATYGRSGPIVFVSGQNDPTWDAGLYQPAALGDFVWDDLNADGMQDVGEPGIDGVTVNLYRSDGTTLVATTTTAGGGAYHFGNLVPSDYIVEFLADAKYTPSPKDTPSDDARDSDAEITTHRTGVITLSNNETNLTVDAGYYVPASLGDYVWQDRNGNGMQDGGELAVDGVTVNLYVAGAPDSVFRTTTTAGGGLYLFPTLVPGDYIVQFVLSGSQRLTRPNLGDDAADSDAAVDTGRAISINLISGEDDRTWDAGIYTPAAVGNYVWLDADGNGIQDSGEIGVPGAEVRLTNLDTSTTVTQTTAGDGSYLFTELPPGNYRIAVIPPTGQVFTQQSAGGDINVNSKVDPATGFMPDFLLESDEANLTKDAGVYRPAITIKKYTNGEDADTEPGPVIAQNSPITWTYYITNTGSVSLTNVSLVDDRIGAVTCPEVILAPGASMMCSVLGAATLGQYANLGSVSAYPPNNAAQTVSATDPSHYNGVDRFITFNALVECRNDGAFVDVAVSDLNFTPSSSTPLTLTWQTVAGDIVYKITDLPLTVNNVIWPDIVVDGFTGPVLGGDPGVVPPGTTIIGWPGWDQDSDGNWFPFDTDLRPQLVLVASVNPVTAQTLAYPDATPLCAGAPRSSLGNFVWNDTNANGLQDEGETGVDGVTVNLYREGVDEPIDTTTTQGGGYYLFTNLRPDTYVVEFVKPQSMVITTPLVPEDTTIDSNPNPANGRTLAIALPAGEDDLSIDAGIYTPALAMKKYTNGVDADTAPGPEILMNTPVTWTYFITNTGTVRLTGISLSDDIIGAVTCPATSLAPMESMKCTVTGNAILGDYANVGTVTGYAPGAETPSLASDPSHYRGYDTMPTIVVKKTADRTELPWPGGPVTFTVVVTNTSVNDIVTLTELTDSIYGNLVGKGTCTMPQTLHLGAAYTCRFTEVVTIPEDNGGNFVHENIVTARGTGTFSEAVSAGGSVIVAVPCEGGGTIAGIVWHDINSNRQVDPGESPFISDPTLAANQRLEVPIMVEENDPSRPVADRTTVVVTKNGQFQMTGLPIGASFTMRVADEPLQALGFLPVKSSLAFNVRTHSCAPTILQIGYNSAIVGLVGDFHWYDVNRDGKQNEWQDANRNGRIDQSTGQFSLRNMEFVDLNGNGVADLDGELIKCGINSTGVDASGKSVGPAVNLETGATASDRTSIVGSTGYYRFGSDGQGNPLSATGTYTVTRNLQDAKTLESARDYASRGTCSPIAVASNRDTVVGALAAEVNAAELEPVEAAATAPIPGPTACGETTANTAFANLTDKPNHADLTLDFAIVCVGADELAGLGDRVWLDSDRDGLQDLSEPGVAGVRVNLYVNGDFTAPMRTVVTGPNGEYTFTGLIPTRYVVEFILPAGRTFTKYQEGSDSGLSSDADQVTGRTQVITLAPRQYDPLWDAGILGDPKPDNPTSDDPTDEPVDESPQFLYLPMINR